MRIAPALLTSLLALGIPAAASAQEDDPADLVVSDEFEEDVEEAAEEAAVGEEEVEEEIGTSEVQPPDPGVAEVKSQVDKFKIRRGFWTQADLGVFFTLGGKNFDILQGEKSKGISNIQPYVGVTFGYDIAYSDSFVFALGIKLGAGFSGGAGRVGSADPSLGAADLATLSTDFAIYEAGALAEIGFFASDRIAINIAVDGGAGFIDPDPSLAAFQDGAGGLKFAPTFGATVGFEYYTLLNDFSVGLDIRGSGTLGEDFIPGLGITVPVRYTF